MPSSQNRLPLSRALADHDQRPAATLKAIQLSDTLTASGTFPPDADEARANATSGAVVISLPPGSEDIIGLPFTACKLDSSANAVSLARSGSDTFAGGGTSISTTVQNGRIGAFWDGSNWRDLFSTVLASGLVVSGGAVRLPLVNYANDAAAAAGGVPIGALYHTTGAVKIRLT